MALFVDLVALSNGLHGSVQMDSVALFSWIGWLRHRGILRDFEQKLSNDFKYFDSASISELKIDIISMWLADCSMEFRK